MVCCVIEVRFESALYSWVDKLAHSAWDSLSTQEYKRVLMNSRLWLPAKFVEWKSSRLHVGFFVEISLGKAQWAFLKFTIIEQPCFKFQQVIWVLCNPAQCYKNLTNCSGCENCGNSWWTAAVAPHLKRVLVVLVFSCNSHMDKILLSLVMCCCVLIINYQQDRFKYKVLFGSKHTDEWLDFW